MTEGNIIVSFAQNAVSQLQQGQNVLTLCHDKKEDILLWTLAYEGR